MQNLLETILSNVYLPVAALYFALLAVSYLWGGRAIKLLIISFWFTFGFILSLTSSSLAFVKKLLFFIPDIYTNYLLFLLVYTASFLLLKAKLSIYFKSSAFAKFILAFSLFALLLPTFSALLLDFFALQSALLDAIVTNGFYFTVAFLVSLISVAFL